MKIQARVILLLLATFLVIGAGAAFLLYKTVFKEFDIIEKNYFQEKLEGLSTSIEQKLEGVYTKMKDWSSWDQSYYFALDHNQQFIKENFSDTSLTDIKLNFISLWDQQGNLIYSHYTSPRHEKPHPIPKEIIQYISQNKGVFIQKSHQEHLNGWMMTTEGPLMFTANPILKVDGSGPIHGTLIAGRYYYDGLESELSRATRLSLHYHERKWMKSIQKKELKRVENQQELLAETNYEKLIGRVKIFDVFGEPIFELHVEQPRTIFQQGERSLAYFFLLYLILGFVALAAGYFFLEFHVLKRIRSVYEQVKLFS